MQCKSSKVKAFAVYMQEVVSIEYVKCLNCISCILCLSQGHTQMHENRESLSAKQTTPESLIGTHSFIFICGENLTYSYAYTFD